MTRIRPLDAVEIRTLGVLMEKQQTTPDYYPMTISAVIAGCNQKSSRDPVMELTETQVVEALDRLATDVLAWRSTGARAERWEHRLDRRWDLDNGTKAVMTLLLLRGPQTPGELRSRGGRMHTFGGLEEVEGALRRLAAGPDALVKQLPRVVGRREIRWMHLVGDEQATQAIEAQAEAAAVGPPPRVSAPSAATAALNERVERLETQVRDLERALNGLVERLGG